MAIFYEGIKALNGQYYSYLLWENSTNNFDSDENPSYWTANTTSVLLSAVKTTANVNNKGHLLTSNVNNKLYGNNTSYITFYNNANGIIGSVNKSTNAVEFQGSYRFTNSNNEISLWVDNAQISQLQVTSLSIPNYLEMANDTLRITKPLNVASSVTAVYFNTQSDRRAKTKIQVANFDALDIVKNLSIYSFIYKDSRIPSIGIMAQEAQNIQIEDFSIVNNKNATGINGDYMNISESKLVYILWKAIQEQQEEIEKLKSQLEVK